MKKRMISFLIMSVLLISLSLSAAAHEVPDLEKTGSITFTVDFEKEPLDGGSLTLYRVGDIVENNGDYSFGMVEKLDPEQAAIDKPEDPQVAKELAAKAAEAKLVGITAPIQKGEAVFADVEPGLYVVVQEEATEGFEAMNPFLISMPKFENGVYVTEVKVDPKVSLEKKPEPPSEPPPPNLPQTGQLNWPVPLLAAGGLVMVLLGWILCNKSKKEM